MTSTAIAPLTTGTANPNFDSNSPTAHGERHAHGGGRRGNHHHGVRSHRGEGCGRESLAQKAGRFGRTDDEGHRHGHSGREHAGRVHAFHGHRSGLSGSRSPTRRSQSPEGALSGKELRESKFGEHGRRRHSRGGHGHGEGKGLHAAHGRRGGDRGMGESPSLPMEGDGLALSEVGGDSLVSDVEGRKRHGHGRNGRFRGGKRGVSALSGGDVPQVDSAMTDEDLSLGSKEEQGDPKA